MWIVLTALLLITVILIVSPVTMEIKYNYSYGEKPPREREPGRGIRVSLLWGLVNLRLKLSSGRLNRRTFTPVLKLKAKLFGKRDATTAGEKTGLSPRRAVGLYRKALIIYRVAAPANRYLLSKINLHRFSWRTALGLPEAGQTGMAVGFLWAVKGNATSYLYRSLKCAAPGPELEILPVFDQMLARVRFDCIFSLKMGHIIYTGLLAGWHFLKNRRQVWG